MSQRGAEWLALRSFIQLKANFALAAVIAVGASAAGVGALDHVPNLYGSPGMADLSLSVLNQCVALHGLGDPIANRGGGSSTGEAVLQLSGASATQLIAPMSRPLGAGICGVASANRAGAEGMVVALDAVSIVVNSSNAGPEGIDYAGTAGNASNQWRTVLRQIYAGMPDAAGGNLFARDCNSAARQAIVNNWDNVFHGTVTACADSHPSVPGTGVNGYDQNNAIVEPGVRHAFRREDESGTTDVFLAQLALPAINFAQPAPSGATTVQAAVYRALAGSPFCNNKRPEDKWQPVTLAANATLGWNQSQIPELTPVGVPSGAGTGLGYAMYAKGSTNPKNMSPFFDEYTDQDPIRRKCVGRGSNANANLPMEQVCSADGALGVVLPIVVPSGLTAAEAYPTLPCEPGKGFVFGPALIRPAGEPLRCPNGDISQDFQCLLPVRSDATQPGGVAFDCINPPSNTPQFVIDQDGNGSQYADAPNTDGRTDVDGRAYNLVLRKPDGSIRQVSRPDPFKPGLTTTAVAAAYYRIHTTRSLLLPPNHATSVCGANTDSSDQIGCLAQASPCSIGFAGRRSVTNNSGTVAALVNGIANTKANIQALLLGGNAYPLASKLYLNTLRGFEQLHDSDASTPGTDAEEELTKCFATLPFNGAINVESTALGLTKLPAMNGAATEKPLCEDFDGQALCGDSTNTDACVGNETIAGGAIPGSSAAPSQCSGGGTVNDGNSCTADSCNAAGAVVHTPLTGTACDDASLCNGHETCVAGACTVGAPPSVDDGNPCTADSCDPALGVIHTALSGTHCDDATLCNGSETCSAGACTPGMPPVVNDGDLCTTDACNASTGQVTHTPDPSCGGTVHNDCVAGRGHVCTSSADCAGVASACVGGACQIPCGQVPQGSISEVPKRNLCALGEACQAVQSGAQTKYVCKSVPFRMDLNQLDSCIYHFVEGITPALGSGSQCSMIRELTDLLDQNGDGAFNIFDVDQCIKSFLSDTPCDPQAQTCPNAQTYCASDVTCGEGLFCNLDMHRCERECGFIPDRDNTSVSSLDRQCTGRLQTCDYGRGQCHDVTLDGATCELDRDCPVGAYCLVGQCQPRCYRTLDCPDSNWFCSTENACLPKPRPSADGSVFNPKDYSVVYARDSIALDPFQNEYSIPLAIMNLKTGAQVFSDPKVVFGYRLETKYQVKADAKCSGDLTLLTQSEQEDCLVAPAEEFLTLDNPFGTLLAAGDPSSTVRVNATAANALSPGSYPVVLTAHFSNGQSTSVRIVFRKPSPSGEYGGRLSAYLGSPDAHLATTNVAMSLYIDTNAQPTNWAALMLANNLQGEKEFQDITEGYLVSGYIHAGQSLLFDNPTAAAKADNEIPVKGLYSPKLGRMRLISVINLPKTTCRNSAGLPCTGAADEWQANNALNRDVRRVIEFIGPFKPAERSFEGIYRETISGLAPNTFTVEGGFRMTQLSQDTRAISMPAPLLAPAPAGSSGVVTFPAASDLLSQLASKMTQACGAATAGTLSSATAVDAYFTSYGNAAPKFPAKRFSELVTNTIGSVANSPATLTLAEFLAGTQLFCTPTKTTDCVDQTQLACGLAFMRRAELAGWFDLGALGKESSGLDASPAVFCSRASSPTTCADPSVPDARGAVMLQDQARFYRELVQTYVYQANAAWSDAFYALYKAAEQGDAFGSAFAFKEGKLREVMKNYDAARDLMLGAPASAAMFAWPMRRFQTQGDAWLRQMQTVLSDRLDAWLEFADLERRIIKTSDLDKTFTFAKHVVNQEYLMQVMLAELQRQWQGPSFTYAGASADVLARGDVFLAKLSDTRNPLGLSPDRVYFENSTPQVNNWQNYRSLLETRLESTTNTIKLAVNNLHGALASQAGLQTQLLQTQQGRDASLDDLCGPPTVDPPACRSDATDKAVQTSCSGSDCAYPWKCDTSDENGACARVVKLFSTAVDTVSCRSDIDPNRFTVAIKGADNAVLYSRDCNHGRVGSLLQERVKLDLERKQSKRQVESLLRQIAREQQELATTQASNQGLLEYLKKQRAKFVEVEAAIALANFTYDIANTTAGGIDCLVIIGLADGTDCPQKLISAGLKNAALIAKDAVTSAANLALSDMTRAKEITYQEKAGDAQVRQLRLQLDGLVASVENVIGQYQLQTQQLYNIDLQVADALKSAQNVADRFGAQTSNVVNRLMGEDSSQTLRSNQLVRQADKEFQGLLVLAYKMTRAFLHRYNYADQSEVWTNRAYSLMTVADVVKLKDDLVSNEQAYCGAQPGADCDQVNNRKVFEFSMRKQLFPQLKDIVDPVTGNVLLAGAQFHNLITSSAFRRKRLWQGVPIEQIELPFAIRANDLGSANSAQAPWMLVPGTCNHIIASDPARTGTIAVSVSGERIGRGFKSDRLVNFVLYRGGTDELRSCAKDGISVNRFQVGSPVIEASSGVFFQTAGTFSACLNKNDDLSDPGKRDGTGCWNFFARDRSLAAPDYVLAIPLLQQEWIVGFENTGSPLAGTPIPEQERGQINDVTLYVRFNDQTSAF